MSLLLQTLKREQVMIDQGYLTEVEYRQIGKTGEDVS
jgi:hypothetical protein